MQELTLVSERLAICPVTMVELAPAFDGNRQVQITRNPDDFRGWFPNLSIIDPP